MAGDKQFDDWKKQLQETAKIQKKLHSGIQDYLEVVKALGEAQDNLNHAKEQHKKHTEEVKDIETEVKSLQAGIRTGIIANTAATRKQVKDLEKKLKISKKLNKLLDDEVKSLENVSDELATQVAQTNKLALGFNSLEKGWKRMPGLIKKGFGTLKGTGIFDIDKSLRIAGRSMNTLGDNFKGFSKNINTANKVTGMWGVGTADLAKAQQAYSEEIGRSVMLNEEGLIAIGEMAAGTGLGADGAAQMASEMDKFNISVIGSKDIVEETVKLAAKMGVNSEKAIKTLQTNLRLSQRFHFKGGVKGLTTMSNEAARLRIDMEGITGLAEKVFRPEGAVEMAAQLAVMGGEFAKLGDFNTLMYKARNDFGGFAKDIAKATVEFVDFNAETGETVIKGGLAADRMREISKITGIQVEKLQEMAGQQKRLQQFGSLIPPIITDKEDRDLIASLATMKDGEATIRINNDDFKLKNLDDTMLTLYKNEQKTLKKRAEATQTFDDVITNFVATLKTTLLPFVQGLKTGLGKPIQKLIDTWTKEGFYKKIEDFGEKAGELISNIGQAVISFVDFLGPKGTLATILGVTGLFKAASWIYNGRMLAMGFNMAARANPGGGSGAFGNGMGASSRVNPNRFATGKGLRNIKRLGRGGGVLAGAMSGYDEYTSNQAMGMDTGENVGRTAIRGSASGLGAWGGAALGTAIFPGVGTVIGGIAGGLGGDALGDSLGNQVMGNRGVEANYGNVGNVNDGIIKFNPNDKFINVDKDTMVAGTNTNGNKELAKNLSSSGGGNVTHSFEDLNIKIDINSDSSWLNKIGGDIVNDRRFVRELSTKIQEEIRMAIGGGKLNPNPI